MYETQVNRASALVMSLIAIAAMLFGLSGPSLGDKGPIGIANLYQVDKLPYIYTGVRAVGFSSHDRGGGNSDAGKFLWQSGGENCMMDVTGPGCVYRIWVTGVSLTDRIRVYLDNEASPRVNKTVSELFGGTAAPFLSPLVGLDSVSSGGFYCYVPMPFRTACKITIDNAGCYYNVQYQQFDDATGVTTFTGSESVAAVVNQWNNCGTDPKGTPDARTRTGTVTIPAGNTVTLIDETGPGSINRIKISIPRLDTYDDTSRQIMWNARLKIFWDNSPTPKVDAPIGPFFGSFYPGTTVRGLFVGTTTPSQFYCFFPMPFGSRARVLVYNASSYTIPSLSYDIGIADMADAPTMLAAQQIGHFAATWREENLTSGTDFQLRSVSGTGVAVGLSINMVGPGGTNRSYLEGDERIHFDGSLTPDIYGTGTEDFFNGGWYFNRDTFNRPLHGNPTHIGSPTDTTSCYRLLLGDRWQYKNGLFAGLEHGPTNDVGGFYSCVFYGYEAGAATLTQTDMFDVGDTTSETSHSYTISGQQWSGTNTFQYEGDSDYVNISDNGRQFSGYSQFRMAVDANNGGAILRCRNDYAQSGQKVNVYVDGALVGTWYLAGSNSQKRWRDAEFQIPAGFTAGKTSVTIKLAYVSGSWWAEYRYWMFSIRDTSVSPGTIAGNVSASGGGAISGAHVVATPGYYSRDTDGSGNYSMGSIPPGTYTLTVTKMGYATQSRSITVSSGSTTTANFTLSPAVAVGSPSAAKAQPDDTWVRVDDLIVTAIFDALGRFYVERPDRASGIGVEGSGVAVGDKINITAQTATTDGERVLRNPVIQTIAQNQTVPAALVMPHRSLGGGADGYQAAVINNASSNAYATGRNNIGLLARIWGKVTHSDTSGGTFYVDDGSRIADGSGRTGVKVIATGMPIPSVNNQIGVTGISSATVINGKVARVIRPRSAGDIEYPAGANLLTNPGFETGSQAGWTAVSSGGSVQCSAWFGGITAHSGNCFNGSATDGTPASGYLYQRIPAVSGRTYVASAWSAVYWLNNNSTAARNRIGIDPYGGTGTPSPNVVWSAYDTQPSGGTWAWRNIQISAVAASTYVTVYLEMNQQISGGWHINCFDDVDCHGL